MRQLKIETLPKKKENEWIEHDVIILHACFQVLSNFVEKDNYHLINNWEEGSPSKAFCDEIDQLYAWWQTRKLLVYPQTDLENEDQTMLKRLIEIRESIWV